MLLCNREIKDMISSYGHERTHVSGHANVSQECIVSLVLHGMALYFNTGESANKKKETRKSQQNYNEISSCQ